MKAHSLNNAPLHDPWLNPPDDEPWCDSCDHQLDRCACDQDDQCSEIHAGCSPEFLRGEVRRADPS